MSIIRLPIDTKSLYFNIKNDNEHGHTATVATPLKQGASIHEELSKIITIPENINEYCRDALVSQILSKSRAEAIIPNVFVFDKIKVNGEEITCDASFCIYVREETSLSNVHCGRQKVHYPPSLKYSDTEIEINNRSVVRAISSYLKDYAFIVEAFEYDTETSFLNFDVSIIGENNMPYSKVFLNKKGVGNKFSSVFNEFADTYDAEIISLREHLGYEKVNPDNYMDIVNGNKAAALKCVAETLLDCGFTKVRLLNEEYPYSIYDIDYEDKGKKNYVIVRFTSTKTKFFSLPYNKIKLCNDFTDSTHIALVIDINGKPEICWYNMQDLNGMNKMINSITYTSGGK